MKNTPSRIKNNYSESPKTPGGISKSLLTPCRRVGLSRNWRSKGSVSPFISPLSSITDEPQNESRKRKKGTIEERDRYGDSITSERELKEDGQNENLISCNTPRSTFNRTPSRSLTLRKKSKTLELTQDNEVQNNCDQDEMNTSICTYDSEENNSSSSKELLEEHPVETKVSKPLRLKTKNKTFISDSETTNKIPEIQKEKLEKKILKINNNDNNSEQIEVSKSNEEKSPNNLTKECIVVIQKKIFESTPTNTNTDTASTKRNPIQTSCESDSDDIPLCNMGSKENITNGDNLKTIDNVGESKTSVKKIDKTTSVTDLKTKTRVKDKKSEKKHKFKFDCSKTSSQSSNSLDDDDDDFQIDKRTILIKKSYNKLVKPTKSKSTGSISQKDIDELRARIERKKNLLMAKAMSNETEELRGLIKKWQQGCQTALTELFELMKRKMPEQNMDYSEILKILKIPPDLVGYDSENDCFNTPDDKNILLSSLDLNKI